MSTSGTYDFSRTRDDIIKAALRVLGVIGKGEEPEQEDLDNGAEALNMMIKSMHKDLVPFWTVVERIVNLQTDVRTYPLGGGGTWDDMSRVGVSSETEGSNPNSIELGGVIEIEIVNGGTGYSSAPTVVITGDGVNAAATATLTADVVTAITITTNGSRYSYPPEITFVGSNTTPCVAVARINSSAGGNDVDTGSAGEGRPGSAGSVSYNPIGGNKPLKLVSAFARKRSTGVDRPITILSRDHYNMLGNKFSTGSVNSVYYDHQIGSGILYVYNVPTSDAEDLHLFVQRYIQDAGDAADMPDFPVEYYNFLKWNLADDMSIESGANKDLIDRVAARAKHEKDKIAGYDQEEASIRFTRARRRG